MNVLVTGATGFVGQKVVQRLLLDGARVHVLVRAEKDRAFLEVLGAKVFIGSVGDPNHILSAARTCDVVVHGAAVSQPRAAKRALEWTNVAGTENALQASKHAGVKRFVHISCSDVTLANEPRVHWNEDRTNAHSLVDAHASSKRLAEELLFPASTPEFQTLALRPAPLWGPGDLSRLPTLCREALENGGLALHGDGRNLISTLYIDNFVDAVSLSLTAESAEGRAMYVADEEFLEAREFYGMLSRALELPAPRTSWSFELSYLIAGLRELVGSQGAHRTDVLTRAKGAHFDTQKARTLLSWVPRTSVEDGMTALAAWVKDRGGAAALAKLEKPLATAESVDEHFVGANASPANS